MAFISPASLQDLCLDFVATGMSGASQCQCSYDDESDRPSPDPHSPSCLLFQVLNHTDYFHLHSSLADKLLSRMAERNTLCCDTISAFIPKSTTLRHVTIKSSGPFHRGLSILRQHQVIDLVYEEAVNKQERAVVNKIVGCLSNWSRANLRSLSVSGCTFVEATCPAVIVSLTSLHDLRVLNVSRTE